MAAVASASMDIAEIVWRHGWNATSAQTLDPGFAYFRQDDACVAYVETGGKAWVAAGAPLASEDRLGDVAEAFVSAARESGRRCCFFATEPRFVQRVEGRLAALIIGEQPVWDPARWDEKLRRSPSLREQLRRARAKGIRVRRLHAEERRELLGALRDLTARWLASKGLAPMGFVVRVFPEAPHRECFVAMREEKLVAFALVLPVPLRAGWFLEHVVRDPRAPNGTTELLVDAVMRWAAERGCNWMTLGLAPLAGDVHPALAAIRHLASGLYNFEGSRAYKAKLLPDRWYPITLTFPPDQGAWISVLDALRAFAPEGLLPFALRSLLRRRIRA